MNGGSKFCDACSVDGNKGIIWFLSILNGGMSGGRCKEIFGSHYGCRGKESVEDLGLREKEG